MTAHTASLADLTDGKVQVGTKSVKQRTFSHPSGADKSPPMAFCHIIAQQIEPHTLFRTEGKNRQGRPIKGPEFRGHFSGTGQVSFVDNEKGLEAGRTGRHDGTADKPGGRQGPRRDPHAEHAEVGADQMHRAAPVTAASFGGTGQSIQNLAANQYRIPHHVPGVALNPHLMPFAVIKKRFDGYSEMGDNHPLASWRFCRSG